MEYSKRAQRCDGSATLGAAGKAITWHEHLEHVFDESREVCQRPCEDGMDAANPRHEVCFKKNLSFRLLSQYFHLPIDAASKELNVCPTVLKKICRLHGLPRWPHRKVINGYSRQCSS